jgi:hypothetical protein
MQMLRSFKYFLLVLSVLPVSLFAKGGVYGAFFGEESEFVCYPSVHRNFFLAIFAGVIVAGLFAWSRFRLKSKTARQLEDKNRVIEEQNKDILDSIRYASRLQQALEPEQEDLGKMLPESFFYLRPRDIVGEIFISFRNTKEKSLSPPLIVQGTEFPERFSLSLVTMHYETHWRKHRILIRLK